MAGWKTEVFQPARLYAGNMYIPVKDHLFYHGLAASGAFAHYHYISFCGNGDA